MRRYLPLLAFLTLISPLSASAAPVDINTASAGELESLPGIGPSKASAIVQYRTDHGPFASAAGIQDVSGIGPSTYANVEALITVSVPSSASASPSATSGAPEPVSAPQSSTAYVPLPSGLVVDAGTNRTVLLEVPQRFGVRVRTRAGADDPAAHIAWAFGDGSASSGTEVEKTYRYPGTYLVEAIARDGVATGKSAFTVTVVRAEPRVASVGGAGVVIANDASTTLELSGWRLVSGGGTFRFSPGTAILPHAQVLFAQTVTGLPVAFDAALEYPDGLVAAAYIPPAPPARAAAATPVAAAAKPSRSAKGSQDMQAVESVQSPVTVSNHDTQTVSAPATTSQLAAAGAAVSAPQAKHRSMLRSPWTYGALGVIVVAGAAFMLL